MFRSLACASIVALVALGCRSDVDRLVNPKPGVDFETATTHVPQFTDIPIPLGYRVPKDNFDAYITEAGSFRAGRQTYLGSGRAIDASLYFEERMPNHGWTLSDRGTRDDGSQYQLWRKAGTAALIEIAPETAAGSVRLDLRVGTSLDPDYRP